VSIPALAFTPTLPRPLGVREFALENRLHVVVVARPSFPTVAARLFIASPPDLDDDIAARRAHFLGATFLRPLQGIPRTTAGCGDTACVVASDDLSDGLARALDRIADLVLVVAPNRTEYERRLTALRTVEGQASEALSNAVRAVMFGQGHRYGGPPLVGEGPSLAELEALRARAFVPSAATLVVVGDTTAQAVRAEVVRRLAAWGPVVASAPRVPPAPPPLPEGPHVRFYASRSLRQLRAILAVRGPKPTDRDAAAFVVLAKMLGGGMDSAVFHEVREELGAAYSVGEVIDWYPDASVLKLSASFDPQRATEGLQGWINTQWLRRNSRSWRLTTWSAPRP
jgi:predicted Zn-dependent peptidase